MRGLILALILGLKAWAEPPILINQDSIDITTNFRGAEISLTTYLDAPDPNARLIIIGPKGTLTVRRKERRAGLWLNASKIELKDVPTYIALQGYDARQFAEVCTDDPQFLSWVCDEEVRDLMQAKGLFSMGKHEALTDLNNGFYRTSAFLPATAKPGSYEVRFEATGMETTATIQVQRAGLERLVLETAQNQRLFYGVLCLILAAFAGWVTNLIFSRR